jgi:hypothetical protein
MSRFGALVPLASYLKEIGLPPTYFVIWLVEKKQEAKQQPKKFILHCFVDSYKLDQ